VASLGTDQSVRLDPLQAPAGATPVVGDFNGDGRDDVVWYRAGSGSDEQWTSKAGGGWTVTTVSVSGTYRPVVGDFDGNGRADLLWYAPGTARDSIWTFTGTSHASVPIAVNGSYFPVVLDQDGDHRADVYWQSRRSTVRSSVWSWPSRALSRPSSRTATTTYTPGVAGDFDGDGRDDILFDRAGDSADTWWWTAAGLTP
jgi:hypothetical protein